MTDARIKLLTEGPGGIMEMKQTIANKEAEIARLQKYRNFVMSFYYEPMELSHHKLPSQYNHWQQTAGKLIYQNEPDTGFTDEELGHRNTKNEQA